jgi:hypothetical protein
MRIKQDRPTYNAPIYLRTECSERKTRRGPNKEKIDASTKRPLPVLVMPFKTSPNVFIPDNHEFQVKIALV